jgi:hypothetical protein
MPGKYNQQLSRNKNKKSKEDEGAELNAFFPLPIQVVPLTSIMLFVK